MTMSNLFGKLPVYRIDVRQGNQVDPEMVAKLKPGMTRSQVRFVMGTPLVTDVFHPDRWDYVYEERRAGKLVAQRRVTLLFEGDRLARIDNAHIGDGHIGDGAMPAAAPTPAPALAPAAATVAAEPKVAAPPAEVAVVPTASAAPPTPEPQAGAEAVSASAPATEAAPPSSFALATEIAALTPAVSEAGPGAQASEDPEAQAMRVVQSWADAWSRRDTNAYFAHYDTSFVPPGGASVATWRARRAGLMQRAKSIEVKLDAPVVELIDATHAEVRFRQDFASDTYRDSVYKQLTLVKNGGVWLIAREAVTEGRP
jgi:outer membrane protein assembly factor BamE